MGSLGFLLRALFFATNRESYWISIEYVFLTEAQKKQMEDNADLIQEECISENADNSTEEPIEGGPDADGDGEEMTDGIEEDFDEDGSNELVRNNHAMSVYTGATSNHRKAIIWVSKKSSQQHCDVL